MTRDRVLTVVKTIGLWIPVVLLLFIFLPQGWSKFSDSSGWATAFRHWGYPDWFRVTIGVIEIGAALLLVWPRTATLGAALIICVMLGGMATHLLKDGGRHLTSEVVPLVLATIVLVTRRREARWLFVSAGLAAACHSPSTTTARAELPTPAVLFARYASASGGATAINVLESRITVGELITAGGMRAPLEIYQAAPDRFLRVLRNTQVKLSQNGFDGTRAWSANDGRTRDVDGPELAMFRREYHLRRPLMLASFYARFGDVRSDTGVYSVVATTTDGSDETLYFGRDDGLLRGWDVTVQGTVVTTRLDDYRRVDAVMVPFRVTRSRPGFTWTEQATEIRDNVTIDDARFRKPH